MSTWVTKFGTEQERQEAIRSGETSARRSSLMDGRKHYAVVEYDNDGGSRIEKNLTGTDLDDLRTAEHLAENRDHGPFAPGVAVRGRADRVKEEDVARTNQSIVIGSLRVGAVSFGDGEPIVGELSVEDREFAEDSWDRSDDGDSVDAIEFGRRDG